MHHLEVRRADMSKKKVVRPKPPDGDGFELRGGVEIVGYVLPMVGDRVRVATDYVCLLYTSDAADE